MYLTVFLFDSDNNQEDEDRINDTVAIRYFSDLSLAQLYSNYLNECSITNYLTNTFMNQMIPGLEQIQLHIRKSDHLRALEYLIEFESQNLNFFSRTEQNKPPNNFSSRLKPYIIVFIAITIILLLFKNLG
jgi:hypothetical protein